ncbi:sugar O-acetyltransferase [Tateyamaria sp.]|uniref:sugar O-acetyltransferase n=1 Tax=Tateyamaria sp. TaxID=1929288 RepID=UPI003B215262
MMPSELEKMRAGDWYTCLDPELEMMRVAALDAVYAHNQLAPSDRRSLSTPLARLFGSHGRNCLVEAPFHCSYGFNTHLGDDVFLNVGCVILDSAPVHIGSGALCGPGVQIYCATHHTNISKRRAGVENARSVHIGQSVWLGGNVIVLPGVSIGDGAIVGAGSVVTRDIAAGAKVAGNPARPL